MQRRHFLAATAVLAAPAWAQPAQPALPSGPVRIVVGFPPGGGTDVLARILAQKLAPIWGVPVIVDNRAGASGVIAADHVAKQASDGQHAADGPHQQPRHRLGPAAPVGLFGRP
jgi:tripartite-type tricarboxylate transporter receptor subunit TctC